MEEDFGTEPVAVTTLSEKGQAVLGFDVMHGPPMRHAMAKSETKKAEDKWLQSEGHK